MKVATLTCAGITVLLITSTMICGLWMAKNNITDPSSLAFHTNCGIASAGFCLITMALLVVLFARMKRKG
jgi:hypothetical protein